MTTHEQDQLVELLERAALFDMDWYVARYEDVAMTGVHPALHYLKYGAALGRDPGPGFETAYYVRANPDMARTGQNPLVHYLQQGQGEGRAPTMQAALDQRGAGLVAGLRESLWGQGLADPALAELSRLQTEGKTPLVRALAAWEQAIFALRQGENKRALDFITQARAGIEEPAARRRLVVLEQMAYLADKDRAGAFAAYDYANSRGHAGPDAMLARANFEATPGARLAMLNTVLAGYALPPLRLMGEGTGFDQITCLASDAPGAVHTGPNVTVILAAYNAEATLGTALRSISEQSWRPLEILVVDDASTDGTVALARQWAERDARITVIPLEQNIGAYAARNVALAQATGDFVTLMDADDWAHPARIERHMAHMLGHPSCMASLSPQVRVREDLHYLRWTGRGDLITRNTASVFFQRQAICDHLGGWDTVRVSADNEMIRRMGHVFGTQAVADLSGGPLTLQRDHGASAVADPVLGMRGELYGARRAYAEAQRHHHAKAGVSLRYEGRAPFAVPALLRKAQVAPVRIILAGDFRLGGATLAAALEQMDLAQATGLSLGVMHWPRFDPQVRGDMQAALRDRIDAQQVQELTYGEEVSCDVLLILDAACLEHVPGYLPQVTAGRKCVVLRDGEPLPERLAGPDRDLLWAPIGPVSRELVLSDPSKTLFEGEWQENAEPGPTRTAWYNAALQQLGVTL